jgi:lipopolysaccharide transport system ATP-binding protein
MCSKIKISENFNHLRNIKNDSQFEFKSQIQFQRELAISVRSLSKYYLIYNKPHDRLKQSLFPRFQKLTGKPVKKYYEEFCALQDVSFDIKRGEMVGVIGRNGSGKSTLLQIICGTSIQSDGSVYTNGRIAALLELGAGFNTEFTGRENCFLNAAILGIPRNVMRDKMEQVLSFSELGEFIDRPVKTYSSGMYARLAFSIAIHVDPEILVVDETLSVGDARFVAKCMRRIKDIKEQGTTILFVSHDVSSVRTLCERAIWLDRGLMVEQGDVFPITGRYMEFLFKDEQAPEEKLRQEIDNHNNKNNSKLNSVEIHANTLSVDENIIKLDNNKDMENLDSRPVTHWGSHKGLILSACVRDMHSNRKDVYILDDEIEVNIELLVPKEISRRYLSIAFSIKDLKGTDLIVSTTHDLKSTRLPEIERFSVSFRLINLLVTGKYLLVAAVENRQYSQIHYYEYLEGAHYFSSLSDSNIFGVFQPPIKQFIKVK